MTENKAEPYAVGYGKPPIKSRFQPGRSGNPKGRPKKTVTLQDDIESELRSPINVVEAGTSRKVSKRRAIVKRHVMKAMDGDVRSAELILKVGQTQDVKQHDNLGSLLEEFREKNRRLSGNEVTATELQDHSDEAHSR